MKKIFFFFLGLSLQTAFAAEKQNDWVMAIGEKKVLTGNSLWIENKSVAKAEVVRGKLQIKAIKPGVSDLKIDNQTNLTLTVLKLSQAKTLTSLKKIIEQTLNLQASVVSGKIVLSGRLVRWSDFEQILQVCSELVCDYENRISWNTSHLSLLKEKINSELSKSGLPQVILENGESLSLRTPVSLPEDSGMAKIIAKYGVAQVIDAATLNLEPIVKVQIRVAEIKKDQALKYGISLPSQMNARLLPDFALPVGDTLAAINFLEAEGLGRILASPNILCKSGKEAEFLAGGEFPIKILNDRIHDVVWKKYGVILKVKPRADFSGRISLGIETEVSSIDAARSVDGIPGLFTNKIQSYFDLAKPQWIALSGLIKNETGNSTQGFPGLGKIPILGNFFSSKDFRENRTELVVFVRPEVLNPLDMQAPAQMESHFTKDFDGP